jgi:hypothetical protein
MCLFLSMVVWQPFQTCWRYIIARVSEMHVAYHISKNLWYIYISGTNKIQHLKRLCDTTPQFLPYLHYRMCVRGGENNEGYRVRLKMCVRSLLQGTVSTYYSFLLSCVCSSVWSFGSHLTITGVISLRVSPKCTSHIIIINELWYIYILGTNNIQHLQRLCNTTPSFLPSLPASSNLCARRGE